MGKDKFKREECQPLIIVIDIRKAYKMRDQTRTHDQQQNTEPKIRKSSPPDTANKKQTGENNALQNADEKNDTSRIVEIYLRWHKLNFIANRFRL